MTAALTSPGAEAIMADKIPANVIGRLRALLKTLDKVYDHGVPITEKIVRPKARVFARFRPVFAEDHLPGLTKEELRDFLLFENNCHWTGLHRQVNRMCLDMPKLREALRILLYGDGPVGPRLETAIGRVYGMGKGIATAILLIAHPDRYGVWNRTSEAAMQKLGIWPEFDHGTSTGQKYERINELLVILRDELDTDLWTLDSLWWGMNQEGGGEAETGAEEFEETAGGTQAFGLEKYLHEFMWDNWESLDLAKDWQIYVDGGDLDAGVKFPCAVPGTSWEIDILAKHRHEPKWLVIELKRYRSSDQAVGQTLRYIQWVRENLAEPGDEVRGLIVSHEADHAIRYALRAIPFVDLRLYDVQFRLTQAHNAPSAATGE